MHHYSSCATELCISVLDPVPTEAPDVQSVLISGAEWCRKLCWFRTCVTKCSLPTNADNWKRKEQVILGQHISFWMLSAVCQLVALGCSSACGCSNQQISLRVLSATTKQVPFAGVLVPLGYNFMHSQWSPCENPTVNS